MNKRLLLCAMIWTVWVPALVVAEPVNLKAFFDSSLGPNQYVVDFSSLGGGTVFMPIKGGEFELQTDADAGTARLLSWRQDVEPIEILPGLSTGPIEITMEPGSGDQGTYDASSNQFSASATFLINFDDTQLQEFGFTSPMPLVGTERGSIYGAGSIGSIQMFLEGEGTVQGQSFNYTCQTTARFEYTLEEGQAQRGDITKDKALDVSDAIGILNELFLGGSMACSAAADVNGDSEVNLSDAIYLLNFLFLGGPAPTPDAVECEG